MNKYAAMAHKGRMHGKTFAVEAETRYAAIIEAARIANTQPEHISVQLRFTADGREVIGYIG